MHCLIRSFKVTGIIFSLITLILITNFATSLNAAETMAKKGESWKEDWDKILTNAKKEGEVVIYQGSSGVRPKMANEFFKKFGIKVNALSGRPAELLERMSREERAGMPVVDLIITGNENSIELKSRDLISPLDTALMLPEVLDPNKWFGGFPWLEPRYVIQYFWQINNGIWRNTKLVGDSEVKEYSDLLRPQYKKNIIFDDPTTMGGGSLWFSLHYPVLGDNYMKALASQELIILRDRRLQAEWLAREKHPILLAGSLGELLPFKEAGAPIEAVKTKEAGYTGGGSSCLVMAKRSPHPNATRLLLNWFLSKEGQTLWTKETLLPSRRLDVPAEHLNALTVPKVGERYLLDTPVTLARTAEYIKLAKQLFIKK